MNLLLYPLCAAVATMAFCVLFNVRGFNLVLGGLNGGLGYFIYLLIQPWGGALSMFLASAAMAVYAEMAARRRKAPAILFLVPGIIPLVPGGGLFNGLLQLMEGQTAEAWHITLEALLTAGAIAAGIIVASSLLRVLPHRARPAPPPPPAAPGENDECNNGQETP